MGANQKCNFRTRSTPVEEEKKEEEEEEEEEEDEQQRPLYQHVQSFAWRMKKMSANQKCNFRTRSTPCRSRIIIIEIIRRTAFKNL